MQHRDVGYYAMHAHRYHVPVIVPKCVRFEHLREGDVALTGGFHEVPFKEGAPRWGQFHISADALVIHDVVPSSLPCR